LLIADRLFSSSLVTVFLSMATSLLETLGHFITAFISHSGYLGITALMGIESACVPIPSEIIMPFSGYLVSLGRFRLMWVAVAGSLGCNAGSIAAYAVGAYGGRPLAERYGYYLWISKSDLAMADRWFEHFGDWAVFFARLVPLVRTFIALPAGIARMDFLRFNIYTFLGSLPWCWALAYAGMKLGSRWSILREYFHRFDTAIVVLVVAGIVWFVYHRWSHRLSSAG
jgi:membrane protein DedA with SNARE-associated domain